MRPHAMRRCRLQTKSNNTGTIMYLWYLTGNKRDDKEEKERKKKKENLELRLTLRF